MGHDHPIYGNNCAPSSGNFDLFVTQLFIYIRGDRSLLKQLAGLLMTKLFHPIHQRGTGMVAVVVLFTPIWGESLSGSDPSVACCTVRYRSTSNCVMCIEKYSKYPRGAAAFTFLAIILWGDCQRRTLVPPHQWPF